MADADRGPDHGRLDRVIHNLREVRDELNGDETEAVGDALALVRSYRETVEGIQVAWLIGGFGYRKV